MLIFAHYLHNCLFKNNVFCCKNISEKNLFNVISPEANVLLFIDMNCCIDAY